MRLFLTKFRKYLLLLVLAILVLVGVIIYNHPSVLKGTTTHLKDTPIASIPQKPIERSLFGIHIANPDKIPWPTIPIATWRLWDTATRHGMAFWAHLERHKGQWDFRTLDYCVELAQKHGVELIYTMGMTPKWASARPNDNSPYGKGPTPAEPKNMEDWRNYVRTVATRYKGKIHYYEIWNEPNLKHFFSGTVDQMLALSREAYTILKQVDPSIMVLAPALSSNKKGLQWLDEFFRKGGGNYADIITAHFYPVLGKTPEENLPRIYEVQKIIAEHGLQEKPFWNTETGYGNRLTNSFFSDEESIAYVTRSYLLNWASGIERLYWYAWDNRNIVTILMVEEDNKTLTPTAKAYAQLQKWIVGYWMKQCEPDRKNTWMCELTKDGGDTVWIVWNSKREEDLVVPKTLNVNYVNSLNGEKSTLPENRVLNVGQLPVLLSKN